MPNPYARIKTSDVTVFPLTIKQVEALRQSTKIVVPLNKGHGTIEIHAGKEFKVYIYGRDRPPIPVSIVAIRKKKKGGGTAVTLERVEMAR